MSQDVMLELVKSIDQNVRDMSRKLDAKADKSDLTRVDERVRTNERKLHWFSGIGAALAAALGWFRG